MNTRMPLEVLRDGAGADVLDLELCERGRVELEASVVGREHQPAGRPQELQCVTDQHGMVALHVEDALHTLRVRESRRVEEDQIEPRTARGFLFEPLTAICSAERM